MDAFGGLMIATKELSLISRQDNVKCVQQVLFTLKIDWIALFAGQGS